MLLSALLLPISAALAQDVVAGGEVPDLNVQTFRPSLDSHEFFRVIDTDLPQGFLSTQALFSYASDPLQYRRWSGETVDVVGDLVLVDAMAALRLGRVRVGFDLPVYLRSFGGVEAASSGVGDLALDVKWSMVDPSAAPLGVAIQGRRVFATSTMGPGLSVDRSGWDLALAVDKTVGAVGIAANVGTTSHPSVRLEEAAWGSLLYGQVGLNWQTSERFGLVGELYGARVLGASDDVSGPLEALVGATIRAGERRGFFIRPAVGYGLNDAVGTPRVRGLLSFGWDPLKPAVPPDPDADGLISSVDACPTVAEDLDGYEDVDGCPEPTLVRVRVIDTDGIEVLDAPYTTNTGVASKVGETVALEAGKYTFIASGVETAVEVPGGAPFDVKLTVPAPRVALHVEARDLKGRPVTDVNWVGTGPVPIEGFGTSDLQIRPGAYEFSARANGYRPAKRAVQTAVEGTTQVVFQLVPLAAKLVGERIEIKESIYFETSAAVIKSESFALLDEIVQILTDHPELTKVRVEGHTDSRGDNAMNLALSKARAKAVADYIVGKGIAADRVESEGYGETKPLVKGTSSAAYAANRRVDFKVVERNGVAVKALPSKASSKKAPSKKSSSKKSSSKKPSSKKPAPKK